MTFLPIVDRELRARARQGTTYWVRCAVAGIAGLIAFESTALYANALNPALVGPATFGSVCWLGFLAACLAGMATADSLSGERREGTLGLLFLTNLKSRDVVLGKLAATGVTAFYGLVGFLPSLALALLAGGVSPGRVARTGLALIDALFVSLAAGIWISAWTHSQFKAMRGTLLFTGALFVWGWVAGHQGSVLSLAGWLLTLLNPYSAFYLAPDTEYSRGPLLYWLCLFVAQAEGWAVLALATAHLEQNGRVTGPAEEARKPKEKPPPAGQPDPDAATTAAAAAEDRALLENEPVCWAVSRSHGHNVFIWGGALLLLLSGAGGSILGPAGAMGGLGLAGIWSGLSFLASVIAGALLAWGAGRNLFEARRNGELELLLSTPLGARDIVRGHWWALWRPLRGAWLLVVFLAFLQFLFGSGFMLERNSFTLALDVLQRALVPVNKVLDGVAVCWVGMLFGLRANKRFLVAGWTVGLVLVLPWVACNVLLVLLTSNAGITFGRSRPSPELMFWLVMPSVLYFAKNLFFIRWAVRSLRTELRVTAPLALEEWLK